MKYAWIKEHRDCFATVRMCRVLRVSRSAYYDWRKRTPSKREQKRQRIAQVAAYYHERSHEVYGYRKVHEDIMEEEKIDCCKETVRKIMQGLGLFSCVKRKFVHTTDSNHALPVAANVLNRNFEATGPDQKWVADITYIHTMEGWLYLATVLDLYSRRIVGWSMSQHITTKLVYNALKTAVAQRCPSDGLLHHSDRGVQYAAESFQELLELHSIECSMSRKGNCWDNASQESFFGKLKGEWIRNRIYSSREEAKQDIFYYIEVFYNRQRRHAALGYVSPAEYEARHNKETAA